MVENNEKQPENRKGHATPTRREAEQQRKAQLKPARGSKAAKQLDRNKVAAERTATRLAMYTNDDRHLPPRDRGPMRRFVRDFVDARLTLGELFIPIAFVYMILVLNPAMVQYALVVWYLMILGIVLDCALLVRRVRKALAKQFPDQSTRGIVSYTILRSLTLRLTRLPKPTVKVGGAPAAVKIPKSLKR